MNIILSKQELESSGILENLTRLPCLLAMTDSNFYLEFAKRAALITKKKLLYLTKFAF